MEEGRGAGRKGASPALPCVESGTGGGDAPISPFSPTDDVRDGTMLEASWTTGVSDVRKRIAEQEARGRVVIRGRVRSDVFDALYFPEVD